MYKIFLEIRIFCKNFELLDNNSKPLVIELIDNNPNISEIIRNNLKEFDISVKHNGVGWLTPLFNGYYFVDNSMFIVYQINYPLDKKLIKLKEGFQWIENN